MIAPSIDAGDLATRLDRLPAHLRDVLTRELERLGLAVRDRVGGGARLSLAVDSTADTITATIASARLRTAGVPPAPTLTLPRKRGREASAASGWGLSPRRSPLSPALAEIRAGLETAARQAFVE